MLIHAYYAQVATADYCRPVDVADFRRSWEATTPDNDLTEEFRLEKQKSIADTVQALVQVMFMRAWVRACVCACVCAFGLHKNKSCSGYRLGAC